METQPTESIWTARKNAGDVIKASMHRNGLTRKAVCESTIYSQSMVNKIINGEAGSMASVEAVAIAALVRPKAARALAVRVGVAK